MGFCFGRRWWWQDRTVGMESYFLMLLTPQRSQNFQNSHYYHGWWNLPQHLQSTRYRADYQTNHCHHQYQFLLPFSLFCSSLSAATNPLQEKTMPTLPPSTLSLPNGSSVILQNIDPNLGFSSDDGVKVPEIIHSGIELMPRRMLYVLKKMEMTMMTRRAKEEMTREMGFRSRIWTCGFLLPFFVHGYYLLVIVDFLSCILVFRGLFLLFWLDMIC